MEKICLLQECKRCWANNSKKGKTMRADIELLEKVVNEHSEALERLEAARVKAEK